VGYQKRIYPGTDIEATEQKVVDVTANWNIFELSNLYKIKSSKTVETGSRGAAQGVEEDCAA